MLHRRLVLHRRKRLSSFAESADAARKRHSRPRIDEVNHLPLSPQWGRPRDGNAREVGREKLSGPRLSDRQERVVQNGECAMKAALKVLWMVVRGPHRGSAGRHIGAKLRSHRQYHRLQPRRAAAIVAPKASKKRRGFLITLIMSTFHSRRVRSSTDFVITRVVRVRMRPIRDVKLDRPSQ